ncbi:hypothetical protein [Corynebacterium callunae]|uniref:hypothetical protein n=1 Tax=Corynebacterium callunae TaxID=1721 RepID=UPI00200010F1|nr:hypothetical protein [Corynebacterium callunae]MCK2199739.1 hypothetical protein [Corynebacterium callunae]
MTKMSLIDYGHSRSRGPGRRHSTVGPILATMACISLAFANTFIIARAGMVVIFALILVLPFFNKHSNWKNHLVNIPGISFIYYVLISLTFYPPTVASIYNGLVAALAIGVLIMLSTHAPSMDSLNLFIRLMSKAGKLILLLGLAWEILSFPIRWDTKTGFLFVFLFFVLLEKKSTWIGKVFYLCIWVVQAYLADDRTYLIAILVFLLSYFIWPFLARHQGLGKVVIATFLALLMLVPIIYVQLSVSRLRGRLDMFALQYTGGRFFSGRDIIWYHLLEDFWEGNTLIGGGHNLALTTLLGNTLSSHNTFIAVLTRMGFIGLILFLAIFFGLLTKYLKHSEHLIVRFSAAVTIAILFKQSSEFSLIGNNIAHSLVSWLVISFGLIYLNALNREIENRQTVTEFPLQIKGQ